MCGGETKCRYIGEEWGSVWRRKMYLKKQVGIG